jgi:gliding motility-associated-like protein
LDSGLYNLYFIGRGEGCDSRKPLVDSLKYQVHLTFEDPEIQPPPNLITNNSDGKNDSFSLNDVAPISNCASEFDYIEIFNRWGKQIYYNRGADFYWKPDSLTEGLYFYTLHFKRRNPYKGWIQVVR